MLPTSKNSYKNNNKVLNCGIFIDKAKGFKASLVALINQVNPFIKPYIGKENKTSIEEKEYVIKIGVKNNCKG